MNEAPRSGGGLTATLSVIIQPSPQDCDPLQHRLSAEP